MRTLRVAGVVCALPFLLGMSNGNMAVFALPDTVMPDEAVKIDAPFIARPGDVLLTGRIATTQRVFVEGSVDVAVDKFADTLKPGDELTAVLAPPRTSNVVGGDGLYYCGRDQRSRSDLMETLVGGMFSKFEKIVRFCFVDSNGDRSLDTMFLAGAKDKALQAPHAITPVAMRISELDLQPEGQQVRLRYRKHVPEKRVIELELEVTRDGKKQSFDYVLWTKPDLVGLQQAGPRWRTDPKKLDYPVAFDDILGAAIQVRRLEPGGEAEFAIARNFRRGMFRPVSIEYQMIFIYV